MSKFLFNKFMKQICMYQVFGANNLPLKYFNISLRIRIIQFNLREISST